MKKVLSLLLAVIIALTAFIGVSAASKTCNCDTPPVVFVHGFGAYPLYMDMGTDNETQVFPPNTPSIIKSVPAILKVLNTLLVTGNYSRCAGGLTEVLDNMMGYLACDKEGNSIYNVSPEIPPLPTEDKHKRTDYTYDTHADNHQETAQYNFFYDWRLDPMDNAKKLDTYIKHIKKLTRHNKVVLTSHSQGNTVVAAYLSLYSCTDVEKVIFLSPAFKGLYLIGNILTKNITVDGKSDAFTLYLKGLFGNSFGGKIGYELINGLNKGGVLPFVMKRLQKLLEAEFDNVYETELKSLFGYMPGIWSFCPDEYYTQAKKEMFGNGKGYEKLIKKIDNYHYNVQCKLENILYSCKKKGMSFAICAGYDIPSIPVVPGNEQQSDMLIDTAYMTIGATGAQPGKTLGDNYKQKVNCGHNHLSPDGIIDASTCAYPEQTWFFKGQDHNTFKEGYTQFITDLVLYDGQPTVQNMKNYTQFMTNADDGSLVNVEAPGKTKFSLPFKIAA